MDKDLKEAILRTLAYSDIFDFPLTQRELFYYLERYPVDFEALSTSITAISEVGFMDGLFYLSGRESVVDQRRSRKKWSQSKLEVAKQVAAKLALIPWVRMIAVTGTVAAENAEEGHDIDFLIITAPKRLWVTRFVEKVITELMGIRRRPLVEQRREIRDKICTNIYLDVGRLTFPHQDLFTAREIAQMEVVYNRRNTYERFLLANQWVKKWFPNWCSMTLRKSSVLSGSGINPPLAEKRGFSIFIDFLESLAKAVQLRYMAKKRTTETITDNLLMFHPQDQRLRVMREYKEKLRQLGIS